MNAFSLSSLLLLISGSFGRRLRRGLPANVAVGLALDRGRLFRGAPGLSDDLPQDRRPGKLLPQHSGRLNRAFKLFSRDLLQKPDDSLHAPEKTQGMVAQFKKPIHERQCLRAGALGLLLHEIGQRFEKKDLGGRKMPDHALILALFVSGQERMGRDLLCSIEDLHMTGGDPSVQRLAPIRVVG